MAAGLDEVFLRRLELLRLRLAQRSPGQLRGIHKARRSGQGMVFADYRSYAPGDDIRHIDWPTYLRLDRLMLRLFEEEADQPTYLFIDTSASMDFGTPNKFAFACQLVAALAYVALSKMDRVSLIAYAAQAQQPLLARLGKNQFNAALHYLNRLQAGGGTDLEATLRGFFAGPRARGVVLIASDFQQDKDVDGAFQLLRRLRQQVVLLHIDCPDERAPDLASFVSNELSLIDAESGASITCAATPQLVAGYRAARDEFAADLQRRCAAFAWSYVAAPADQPLEQLLLRDLRDSGLLR
jgi:uncharacterized protein (DUF58 family)